MPTSSRRSKISTATTDRGSSLPALDVAAMDEFLGSDADTLAGLAVPAAEA